MPPKQACPASGAFTVLGRKRCLKKRKMQPVAKISCRSGVEIEYWEEEGDFRREKCNMLQKSLVKMMLRLNTGRKKAIIEEKSATCCKNLF